MLKDLQNGSYFIIPLQMLKVHHVDRWMGWVNSKCTQDSQKFTPNCFLYQIMPQKKKKKKINFCLSAKIKTHTLSQAAPPVWPHQHTKHVKTSRIDLCWDHFNFSLQAKTHIWPQKQQFGYVGFQEKLNTPPLKPTKTEPSFRYLN